LNSNLIHTHINEVLVDLEDNGNRRRRSRLYHLENGRWRRERLWRRCRWA
jgi:hypothetical protein